MRISTSQLIGTFALMICFVCPILELIDTWDPPIQSGNDTEYALVIAAICVGMGYFFVRSILVLCRPIGARAASISVRLGQTIHHFASFQFLGSADTGPPALSLRI